MDEARDWWLPGLANRLRRVGDAVVDPAVNPAVDVDSSREMIAALRVGLIFVNLLPAIDVDRLHALLTPTACKPPSWWRVLKNSFNPDARRGIGAAVGLLDLFGGP